MNPITKNNDSLLLKNILHAKRSVGHQEYLRYFGVNKYNISHFNLVLFTLAKITDVKCHFPVRLINTPVSGSAVVKCQYEIERQYIKQSFLHFIFCQLYASPDFNN